MNLKLNNVRSAFLSVFESRSVSNDGDAAYSATVIFSENHPAYKQCLDAIEQVGNEKWGSRWPTIKKELFAKDKVFLHNGDTKAQYEGFSGNWYVSARNKARPTVIDRDRTPLSASDGKPYSGCTVNVLLDVWPQDNAFGRRINASLRGIQFVADGESFSGSAPASSDEFELLADSAEGLV